MIWVAGVALWIGPGFVSVLLAYRWGDEIDIEMAPSSFIPIYGLFGTLMLVAEISGRELSRRVKARRVKMEAERRKREREQLEAEREVSRWLGTPTPDREET